MIQTIKDEADMEERRIYVVVAEVVDTANGAVAQSCGRVAAQCAHVVSMMQVERYRHTHGHFIPTTTVVLAVPDSRGLEYIRSLLISNNHSYMLFRDSNEVVYGSGEVATALCTAPVTRNSMAGIMDFLPLWSHGVEQVVGAA